MYAELFNEGCKSFATAQWCLRHNGVYGTMVQFAISNFQFPICNFQFALSNFQFALFNLHFPICNFKYNNLPDTDTLRFFIYFFLCVSVLH